MIDNRKNIYTTRTPQTKTLIRIWIYGPLVASLKRKSSERQTELERAIRDCRPSPGCVPCGVFCVANKWKLVLNERSLIVSERYNWATYTVVKVKGLKRCKGQNV